MARVRYSFSSRRTGHIENIRRQKEKFPKLVREIIRISDIILEVLDARFIQETRNNELENEIKKPGKKIIYVLNKSDIADLKSKISEVKLLKIYPYIFVSCKKRQGIAKLRNKIKAEVKKLNLGEKRAQVGVIGYPNTGKSSLINLLTGKPSARVSAEAGFTKGMQKIRLSSSILILDTPGVIPEIEYSHTRKEAIQKHSRIGARTIDKIREPGMIVADLVKDYSEQIEKFYGIKAEGDSEILIEQLGRKRNFLKKGGLVDEDRTCRLVIRDWQEGKIRA